MLEPYDCIWQATGLLPGGFVTLSDRTTASFFGGQASQDLQTLETWLSGCTSGNNRLLVIEGIDWASDIDVNCAPPGYGQTFLTNRGIDVRTFDYAQGLAANDLRRCARIDGAASTQVDTLEAEVFGSGCPDNIEIDVYGAVGTGVPLMHFVESLEDGDDPVNCTDDQQRTTWHAVVRNAAGAGTCQRTVGMSFSFAEMYPLNCAEQCLFDDWVPYGDNARLVRNIFQWAGKTVGPVIGVDDPAGAPRFANALYQAEPNPANPSAKIRYTIAEKGLVSLRVFDVSGRHIRTLVNEVQEPTTSGFEVVWDGTADNGQRVSTGVFFYQIDTPGFSSAKKLVILK